MSAKWMQIMLGFKIRCLSLLRGLKQTESNGLIVAFDLGKPFTVFAPDSNKSAFVVFSTPVLCIFGVSGFSQILKSIIFTIAINVVKLFSRPISSHVEPCQSMGSVQNIIKPDDDVSVVHLTPSLFSGCTSPPGQVPCKDSRNGVIINQNFKTFVSEWCVLHGFYNITEDVRCQA